MNLMPEYDVLRFLEWVARCRPDVHSLSHLDPDELMDLVEAFLGSNKIRNEPHLRTRWNASLNQLLHPSFRFREYDNVGRVAKNLQALRDTIRRYRTVPLHAVLLYSTEDPEIDDYLRENWMALNGISGDYCDIYPSLEQLHRAEDAYGLLSAASTDSHSLPGLNDVTVSELPGMLFWDNHGQSAYFPLLRLHGHGHDQLRSSIRHVFSHVRRAPTIDSVRMAASVERARYSPRLRDVPMDRIRVVFFAANPFLASPLALDNEMREITRKVKMATQRDRLQITQAWATQTEDLLQYLNEVQPEIVHFSGHGSSNGELFLASSTGEEQAVPAEALQALFVAFKGTVQVVLLNACYSAVQGKAIAESVPYVIGMKSPISDLAATMFASSFYSALSFGKTVEESFQQGKVALLLSGVDAEVPVLLT